jgi:Putative MetA-pathway of phenol degradation
MSGRIGIGAALLVWISSAALAADEQPICPDRPSKSTGACTVPVGRWQVETGLVDWAHDNSDGVRTDAIAWGNTAIKYGISSEADVELWITPLETLRIHGGDTHQHFSSFGDTLFRVKYHLTPDGAPWEVAVDPFVKIPTANHQLGNGKIEGGLLVPMDGQLGKSGITLSADPEFDVLADQDGHGYHIAMTQVVNFGTSLNEKLNVSAELWANLNWDPAGTTKQYSADVAFAYLPTRNLQLDWGANFGLNKETPDVELYSGVSVRF